jgi:integrase
MTEINMKGSEPAAVASTGKNIDHISFQSHEKYITAGTSENTRKTYRSAVRQFENWGGRLPTDSQTVLKYLLDNSVKLNVRTLSLHLTAISKWHTYQGFSDPTYDPVIRKTLEGMKRIHGKPRRKAKALSLENILSMLTYLEQQDEGLKTKRDIALVLTCYFGAFRRSELVAFKTEDVKWESEGVVFTMPRSKTDQTGEGMTRVIPYSLGDICAVRALRCWLTSANISSGPLFRSINRWGKVGAKSLRPATVNDIVKSLGNSCGFDFVPELSSHSFRRGLSTSAARENLSFEQIKKQGGWKSDATVWGYIDEGRQFQDNVAGHLIDLLGRVYKSRSAS